MIQDVTFYAVWTKRPQAIDVAADVCDKLVVVIITLDLSKLSFIIRTVFNLHNSLILVFFITIFR